MQIIIRLATIIDLTYSVKPSVAFIIKTSFKNLHNNLYLLSAPSVLMFAVHWLVGMWCLILLTIYLTHCGLVMPYGDTYLGQHCPSQWLVA